jgi:hypothetical protein
VYTYHYSDAAFPFSVLTRRIINNYPLLWEYQITCYETYVTSLILIKYMGFNYFLALPTVIFRVVSAWPLLTRFYAGCMALSKKVRIPSPLLLDASSPSSLKNMHLLPFIILSTCLHVRDIVCPISCR